MTWKTGPEEKIEGSNESWEQCEEQLQNVFKEKLGLDNLKNERAHRVRDKRKRQEE